MRLAVLVVLLLVATSLGACHREERVSSRHASFPLGDTLPSAVLTRPDGSRISLREFRAARPALIYLFGVDECAGCSNLSLEFQILQREAPRVLPVLVATGASLETFRPRLQQMGIENAALVDEQSLVLRGLGADSPPLVVLVDSSGRIVFVDTRSASRAAQYPVGHILRDIKGITSALPSSSKR